MSLAISRAYVEHEIQEDETTLRIKFNQSINQSINQWSIAGNVLPAESACGWFFVTTDCRTSCPSTVPHSRCSWSVVWTKCHWTDGRLRFPSCPRPGKRLPFCWWLQCCRSGRFPVVGAPMTPRKIRTNLSASVRRCLSLLPETQLSENLQKKVFFWSFFQYKRKKKQ